jgi:hypothetical protein
MFEIRSPRLTVAKLVVVKNDPGAELTLISPTLYDWAKDKGILFDEIISTRAAAVSFTAGAKAEVNTAAHLHVYLPNMNIPVALQVLRMPGMTDCVNEILLGLDNTEVLGLELSIRNRTSTYHSVPNALEPIVSTHIPFETVSRQYAGGSHIEQVRPTITGATTTSFPLPPAPTELPGQPPAPLPPPPLPPEPSPLLPPVIDNAIASMLPALPTPAPPTPAEELKEDDSADLTPYQLSIEQEDAALEGIAPAHVEALRALVEMGESAVAGGKDALQHYANHLPADFIEWRATPGPRVDNGSVIIEGETDPATIEQQLGKKPYSMALRVDEKTGTVSPIDATGKDVKYRAGHFIVPMTKLELLASIVAKSEASGVPCPPEFVPTGPLDDIHRSSQPKSSQLPVANGLWYYLNLRPDWTPFRSKHRPVPRQLVGRLQKILDSMEKMGIISKCDNAEIVCPITLVLKRDEDGNTTINRLCMDSRPLNARLEKPSGSEQIPLIDSLYQLCEGAYLYTAIDCTKMYWQIPLWKNHKKYSGFSANGSVYCFNRCFFGASTSASVCQRLMCEVVGEDLYGARAGRLHGDTHDEGATVFVDICMSMT